MTGSLSASAGASAWLKRHAGIAPHDGPALDLACGGGRQGRWLLAEGRQVLFCDRDLSGTANLAGRSGAWRVQADLEGGGERGGWPFRDGSFALVVVANYLWRPILADIFAALAPGGVLVYETFMAGNERLGRPRNPDFLLRPGELRDICPPDLEILGFMEGEVTEPRPAMRQALAARRYSAA
ncbi:class I SAM-dependent methyltransferase [Marinibaculum pumilum]|uniref:Class I SAM-dependent methyltransferase n=1 Tax=Marinibaculum pumilum TaxID=1766165 RepID=A0ABV7KTK4_9PROT